MKPCCDRIFQFCNFVFFTLYAKVIRKTSHKLKTSMSQVCNMNLNFIGLKDDKLWTYERLFDKWSTGKEVHIETVKALFHWQNSHEKVFWCFCLPLLHYKKLFVSMRRKTWKFYPDSIPLMCPIHLKFNFSAIDSICDKSIRFQPIRSEYLR